MQASSLAKNEADVILVVGSRLGEYDGWGSHPAWGKPSEQKTIQIDVDANSIGLNRPVDVGILADAKSALKAILSKVKEKRQARTEMEDLPRYRELTQQTQMQGFQFLMAEPTRGLNPGQMVFNARTFFPRNAVTVLDGEAQATATISITVTPVNDAPAVAPDTLVALEHTALDTPLTTLLSNDVDVDGDPLAVTAVATASTGTAVIVGDQVRYTPPAGFLGAATFDYTDDETEVPGEDAFRTEAAERAVLELSAVGRLW